MLAAIATLLLSQRPTSQPTVRVYSAIQTESGMKLALWETSSSEGWSIDPSKIILEAKGRTPDPNAKLTLDVPAGLIAALPFKKSLTGHHLEIPLKLSRNPRGNWYTFSFDVSKAIQPDGSRPLQAAETYPSTLYFPNTGEADDLETLRARWVGKNLWMLGAAATVGPYEFDAWVPSQTVTITGIERMVMPMSNFLASPPGVWTDGWGPTFYTENPLQITLQLPKRKVAREASGVAGAGPFYNPPFDHSPPLVTPMDAPFRPKAAKPTGTLFAADEWHLKMLFTAVPPETYFKGSNKKIWRAFEERRIVLGMPRRAIPYILGYPSYEVPAEDQMGMSTWDYQGMAPFGYAIQFKNGAVASAGMYGDLP